MVGLEKEGARFSVMHITYSVSSKALEIAQFYHCRPWWELSIDEIREALDWWNAGLDTSDSVHTDSAEDR